MAKQAVDVSATWAACLRCPHRHPSHAPCPPTGVWLVLHFCPMCSPAKDLYCRTHRDRHAPPVPAPTPLDESAQALVAARYEHEETDGE